MRSFGRLLTWLLVPVVVLAVACSDDSETKNDGGGDKDGTTQDYGPPPTELICNNDCKDFVLNKIILPDAATATQYGWDFNGDGTPDNALGSILGALAGMASGFAIQESLDKGVNKGSTLFLLRLQAKDFQNEAASKAQTWLGAKAACCSNPDDDAACATESKTTCFKGDYTFYPDSASPKDAIFGGTITGGKMHYGPSKLLFSMEFGDAGALDLNLKMVHLKGTVSADGSKVTSGLLAGVIPKGELDTKLIPTIAKMLQDTLEDPDTEQNVKDTILTLFDSDKDGSVTEQEVKDNSIIKTFLDGDVDVDGDGEKELSLGVGFEGVSAVIDESGTPPDAGPQPDTGAPDSTPVDAGPGDVAATE
jgi:hypothetical protein